MTVMADDHAAHELLIGEGQEQLAVRRLAHEGHFALRVVMGPQYVARVPQGNHRGDVFVAAGPKSQRHGSTGVSPGRPHSAQEPS